MNHHVMCVDVQINVVCEIMFRQSEVSAFSMLTRRNKLCNVSNIPTHAYAMDTQHNRSIYSKLVQIVILFLTYKNKNKIPIF